VTGKHGGALAFQVTSEARHPGEHLERGDVDVGERPPPARNQPVDLVFHPILPAHPTDADILS
jgi:hypothetical protein